MRLIHMVIPLLGALTLITSYILILIKRAEKSAMLNQIAPVNNQLKIVDQSEKFWWPMTLVLVLFTYVGLVAMIMKTTNVLIFKDALFFGLLFFALLIILGYRFVRD